MGSTEDAIFQKISQKPWHDVYRVDSCTDDFGYHRVNAHIFLELGQEEIHAITLYEQPKANRSELEGVF